MGIPSFYKHLLRRFKNITSGSFKSLVGPDVLVSAFMLDFNCIIYAAMKTLKPTVSEAYEVGLRREVGVWLERLISKKTLSPPVAPSPLHERQYFLTIAKQQTKRRCSSAKNYSTKKSVD